ncbi:DUF935 family protein [Campylobacter sp. RM9328]|uniref:phage portal protein family protein n=1 Tax=Campylobacter sp. RM9328 TaxID=1705720 RepID=UPI0014740540|nr:DUF935 family protein [Campylobacter sp. RM9328]
MDKNLKSFLDLLKPKGDYTKTDIQNYVELSAGKIRAALLTKNQQELFPIFNLIEDKDSSVGAEIEKRTSSIINKFFTHELGSKEDENIEEIIKASVEARIFGISLLELYVKDDFSIGISKVDRDFIRIQGNKPFLKIKDKDYEAKEPRFMSITAKPVLIKLLWLVYAKHFVLSHYLKFTEFLGVPPLIANSSSGDEKIIELMAQALSNIKSGSYAVVGPQDVVKVLEGRGNQADFMEFVRYCDAEISKVINGSVLSSNISATGSFAMSQTHELNRKDILAGDVKFAVRNAAKIYAKFGKTPNLNIQIEKDDDLLKRAQVLQILDPLGYSMSAEDLAKEFDLPLPTQSGNANLRLSKNAKTKSLFLDEIDKAAFNANTKKQEDEIKGYIEELLINAESFEEVYENILQKYPNINLEAIEDMLETMIANAHIKGML